MRWEVEGQTEER